MDLPADPSTSTSALPLPYRLQTGGIGWLVAALVLVGLTLAIFACGLRGPPVAIETWVMRSTTSTMNAGSR